MKKKRSEMSLTFLFSTLDEMIRDNTPDNYINMPVINILIAEMFKNMGEEFYAYAGYILAMKFGNRKFKIKSSSELTTEIIQEMGEDRLILLENYTDKIMAAYRNPNKEWVTNKDTRYQFYKMFQDTQASVH